MKSAGILLAAIAVLLGFVAGRYTCPDPETVVLTDTLRVIRTDTLRVPSPPVRIVETAVVRDTVLMIERDTIRTEVAHLDTVFIEGHLLVDYYVAPRIFDLSWQPAPRKTVLKTITKTQYIENRREWWDRPLIMFGGGALFTGVIVSLVR